MKKYIFIFAVLFLLLLPLSREITVFADPSDDIQETEAPPDEDPPIEPEDDDIPQEYILKPPPDAKLEILPEDNCWTQLMKQTQIATNGTWIVIEQQLRNFTTLPVGKDSNPQTVIDIMGQAEKYSVIFRPMGYSLCLLFIGISLFSTTIKYELMTFKGGAKIVAQVLFAKIWVDLSYKICEIIIKYNDEIVIKILDNMNQISLTIAEPDINPSKIWVIGPVIDWFNAFIDYIPLVIIAAVMFIAGAIISIKLMVRVLEITLMVIVSPPFFACLAGGESTQRYFRNFIVNFVSIIIQTIFMSIVLLLGTSWWADMSSLKYTDFIIQFLPNLGLIMVICVMMVKPPRVLKNLIN